MKLTILVILSLTMRSSTLIATFFLTTTYSQGQNSYSRIPITIVDNRPFIETIIGKDTLHFMLDCAAVNVIDLELAKKLKLKDGAEYQQHGAGEAKRTAYETNVDFLKIGSIVFKNQAIVAISLTEIKEKMKLPYLDGLIGYDLFKDSILEINYKDKYVCFLPTYESNKKGIPFVLYRNQIPMIEVSIFDTTAKFIFDTGDRSALTINTPFASKINLAAKYHLSDTTITGYGIGGAVYGQTFILRKLVIQANKYKNILCRIPTGRSGGFARSDFQGSIGGALLSGKRFIINYKTKEIFIV